MINISNLSFGYKHNKDLFRDLNLSIKEGQIHGLLGLNGAGKSSLLHLIQGLRFANQGTIEAYGLSPQKRCAKHLQQSFLLPEEVYTPDISLKQYVDMYSPFYPLFSLESFLQFLNEFELDRTVHLGQLSMGQKKKAVIAFALASNTKILLMDEPTNGLDIPSKKQFRKILSHIITDDRIFLISTHQIRDLHSLIDNVIAISNGKIIFNQSINEIVDKLNFSLDTHPSTLEDLIYHERIPGGYLNIRPSTGTPSFEPDLEVLFNAIITNNNAINQAF